MRLRPASRLLFGVAATLLVVGGALHGLAYPQAAKFIDASSLSARHAAIYKGFWLNDVSMVVLIGVAYLILALRPELANRTLLALLVALPFGSALSIYATVGNFVPGHLLLTSCALALVASLLPRRQTSAVETLSAQPLPDARNR